MCARACVCVLWLLSFAAQSAHLVCILDFRKHTHCSCAHVCVCVWTLCVCVCVCVFCVSVCAFLITSFAFHALVSPNSIFVQCGGPKSTNLPQIIIEMKKFLAPTAHHLSKMGGLLGPGPPMCSLQPPPFEIFLHPFAPISFVPFNGLQLVAFLKLLYMHVSTAFHQVFSHMEWAVCKRMCTMSKERLP